jgi:uroporphyrinogen-III synthase
MPANDIRGPVVAITADRRRDEQATLLERLGFDVRMFPLLETRADGGGALRALTERVAVEPPEFLVANTGYGMRTWLAYASEWGCREDLVKALAGNTAIAARGAKALGELRKAGLEAVYKAPGETLEEVVEWLLGQHPRSVVIQLHGERSDEAVGKLRAAGAEVACLPVYRMDSGGEAIARALVQAAVHGLLDAVTFTAAPQLQALFRQAHQEQLTAELLRQFNNGTVVAACIGEVCASAARGLGITMPLVPPHPRLGSLASALAAHFARRSTEVERNGS